MKILVTGGCGFMASNFIRYMLQKHPDYKIINLDKLTYAANLDNLKDIKNNPNYKLVKGDICDEKLVNKLLKSVDSVVHMAAETHVDRSIEKADNFIQTNVFGTYTLLETAMKHRVNRFLFTSTDEIYGPIKSGSFKEEDPMNPSSPYSASKASADLLCRAYYTTYKLPTIIVRPTNNFGYRQHCEKLIPRFIIRALQNKKLPLFGNGLQKREWLFVMDFIGAMDLVLDKGKIGETYNIGGGRANEKTNLWITRFILKGLKKPESLIEFVKDRPGHDIRYSLDSSKIKKLGWRPKWKLKDGLKETIRWYADNPDYWQPFVKEKFVK